jgi:hypothetical protein
MTPTHNHIPEVIEEKYDDSPDQVSKMQSSGKFAQTIFSSIM